MSKADKSKSNAGKDQEAIDKFIEEMQLDSPVSPEEFKTALKNAYKDRTRQVYFIWKTLKELYPEVDANRVIREGSWAFGIYQGEKIAEKYGSHDLGPVEAILGQTSKAGWLVFDQELLELNNEQAIKLFKACPHVEALTELGESPEVIKMFCRDMLGWCDYAICHPFPSVKIEFPTTVADGEGEGCAMTIRQKEAAGGKPLEG